ncbi:MAG: hypothetical protein CL623_03355 [Arcobacter sp.]|nr:hypothetical protein [Arcobacter sp.]
MTNKIGKVLFKKIFIWYTLIAIILTCYQIYSEYITYDKALNNSLYNTEKSLKKALSSAVWNLDDELTKVTVESIVELDNILGVKITDPKGSLVSKVGNTENIKKVISHKFELYHTKEYIADVILFSSQNITFQNMKNNVKVILINALLKSIFLLLVIYYFTNKMITQILSKLTQALNSTSLSNNSKITFDELSKDNEIYTLIKSFNDMNDRLEKEVHKNKELQDLRLKAMGELLTNIAHQWRQPLAVISTAATGTKFSKEMGELTDEDFNRAMDSINNSTQHLSKTINDFSTLLKKDSIQKEFLISSPINKALDILNTLLKTQNIQIIKNIENISIISSKNELVKVLLSLLNNSKDALTNLEDEKKLIFIKAYKKDEKTIIEVKDNAKGIKEEILNKMFEPYFTTKHQAQGTGLGLYISQNILTNNLHGSISVTNIKYVYKGIEYKGANFTIEI